MADHLLMYCSAKERGGHKAKVVLPYEYQPLESKNKEIRLVRLLPHGSKDSNIKPISCEIVPASLHDSTTKYTALSYTWGDPNTTMMILLNNKSFAVTKNLHDALIHFQDETESHLIWIDAICINQQNDLEKSEQVRLMRDIYAMAAMTILWIGPSADGTDKAMESIEIIGSHVLSLGIAEVALADLQNWNNPEDEPPKKQIKHDLVVFMQQFEDKLASGVDLFGCLQSAALGDRSWFTRTWVIQESMASQQAIFVCGEKPATYDQFWAFWFFLSVWKSWLLAKNTHEPETGRFISTAVLAVLKHSDLRIPTKTLGFRRQRLKTPTGSNLSFKSIICRANVCNSSGERLDATDPRDRVYALVGIANDITTEDLEIDYSKSCDLVYTEAALLLLEKGHIDILALCRKRACEEQIPSWVPDWSAANRIPWGRYREDSLFETSSSLSANVSYDAVSSLLRLTACRVDTVTEVGHIWSYEINANFDYDQAGLILKDIDDYLSRSCQYGDLHKQEAIFRIPIGDLSRSGAFGQEARAIVEDRHGYDLMVTAITRAEDREVYRGEHHKRYISFLGKMTDKHDSRPFISEQGFVGLCPMDTMPGDAIYILGGAHIPFILRSSDSGTFKLVGEAYVYGIMDGEFVSNQPSIESILLG